MLRPFNPNDPELRRFDRIVSDSSTGVLYGVTFAVVYVLFVAVQIATAFPRLCLRRAAGIVNGLHHPV
jgi:hypothetical protein